MWITISGWTSVAEDCLQLDEACDNYKADIFPFVLFRTSPDKQFNMIATRHVRLIYIYPCTFLDRNNMKSTNSLRIREYKKRGQLFFYLSHAVNFHLE